MNNEEFFARVKGILIIIFVLLAVLAMMYVGEVPAQTDSSVKCESPDGQIGWFENYTCPPGWWEI